MKSTITCEADVIVLAFESLSAIISELLFKEQVTLYMGLRRGTLNLSIPMTRIHPIIILALLTLVAAIPLDYLPTATVIVNLYIPEVTSILITSTPIFPQDMVNML